MGRPDIHYADEAAAFVAEHSETVGRQLAAALAPAQPMSNAERRENLRALAVGMIEEAGRPAPWQVVTPNWRAWLRQYATTTDYSAFGRLMLAVAARNDRDADKALDRLAPESVSA